MGNGDVYVEIIVMEWVCDDPVVWINCGGRLTVVKVPSVFSEIEFGMSKVG